MIWSATWPSAPSCTRSPITEHRRLARRCRRSESGHGHPRTGQRGSRQGSKNLAAAQAFQNYLGGKDGGEDPGGRWEPRTRRSTAPRTPCQVASAPWDLNIFEKAGRRTTPPRIRSRRTRPPGTRRENDLLPEAFSRYQAGRRRRQGTRKQMNADLAKEYHVDPTTTRSGRRAGGARHPGRTRTPRQEARPIPHRVAVGGAVRRPAAVRGGGVLHLADLPQRLLQLHHVGRLRRSDLERPGPITSRCSRIRASGARS